MKLEELKEHCLKTLKQTEKFPTKTFEEHALVLRLIENQTSVIEELEKIKAEIKELDVEPDGIHFWCAYRHESVNDFLQILDNHIKELKGDNK